MNLKNYKVIFELIEQQQFAVLCLREHSSTALDFTKYADFNISTRYLIFDFHYNMFFELCNRSETKIYLKFKNKFLNILKIKNLLTTR